MRKNIMLISSVLVLTACSSRAPVEPAVQTIDQARDTLSAHVEKSNMNRNFCSGQGFDYYAENRNSYSFRCMSYFDERDKFVRGGYFHLVK